MSRYLKTNLIPNEYLIFHTTYHWIHYLSLQSLLTIGVLPYIQSKTDKYIVTNRRIIVKKGLLGLYILEMNITKVESINVQRNILGWLLGYGCLTIIGTGGTKETFHQIKNPTAFRKSFLQVLN